MKNYIELVQETLNQRAIIDNRQVVTLNDTSKSVLIAFNQACEFMRDLHNWKWNQKEETYVNTINQDSYPMPYGIVHSLEYKNLDKDETYKLDYVSELSAKECKIPTQWTHDWAAEEIKIAPAVSTSENTTMTIKYHDKNIVCVGLRTSGNLLPRFTLEEQTDNQFLNVPEYIYDAYARCVILKTRIFLNENAQTTLFPAQQQEWQEAYNGLMAYAKTPLYKSEKMEI